MQCNFSKITVANTLLQNEIHIMVNASRLFQNFSKKSCIESVII